MEKQYIQAKIQTVGKKIEFVASDETIDRMGESLKITDWDLRNFKKNPVLLVNHDYKVENIVGKAKNIRRNLQEKKLVFEAVFHDITEKAQSVQKLIEEKFLKTVSVGFIPHSDDKGKSVTLELLEISFVPIPANPAAEQLMVKGFGKIKDLIKDEDKKQIEDFIKKEEKIEEEEKQTKTEVQSLVLSKKTFKTKSDASKWVKDHDFRADKVDVTEDSFRFRQFSPGRCKEGSFRTISITTGVKAVICRPKEGRSAENCILIPEKFIEKQALSKEIRPQVDRPKENSRAVTKVEKKLKRLDLRMLQKVAKYVNNLLYEARKRNKLNR